jgi:hypothetical protein
MAIVARDTQKEFVPAPEGLHGAVCVDVIDLGIIEGPYGKKAMVTLRWQIEEDNPETKKPFVVQRRYGLSLNGKATLRKDLETWRGKKFTKDELTGFDLEKLLAANCQLQVVHNVSDDGAVYANVAAVVPAAKGAPKLVARDYIREKDRPKEGQVARTVVTAPEAEEDEVPF